MGRRGGPRPQPIAGGARSQWRAGRAAGGRRRRGAAAGRRRACAEPPSRPLPRHRCAALVPSLALHCTALHCSPFPVTAPLRSPLPSLHHTDLFHRCTHPPPVPVAAGRCSALPQSLPGIAPSNGSGASRHSLAPPTHCSAFRDTTTPFLLPGMALRGPSRHLTACQAPHCLLAPAAALHCTTPHLPPAETPPNLAVPAATTLHHTSLLSTCCNPTTTLHGLTSGHRGAAHGIFAALRSLQVLLRTASNHCAALPGLTYSHCTEQPDPVTAPGCATLSSLAPSHCPWSLPSHYHPASDDHWAGAPLL